jgi:glycogen(starch) synthase
VVLELSPQRELALPNNFFKYIMAGLSLCVSNLPEMAKIMRQYDLGQLVPDCEPHLIASAINALTREWIDACKQRSRVFRALALAQHQHQSSLLL